MISWEIPRITHLVDHINQKPFTFSASTNVHFTKFSTDWHFRHTTDIRQIYYFQNRSSGTAFRIQPWSCQTRLIFGQLTWNLLCILTAMPLTSFHGDCTLLSCLALSSLLAAILGVYYMSSYIMQLYYEYTIWVLILCSHIRSIYEFLYYAAILGVYYMSSYIMQLY